MKKDFQNVSITFALLTLVFTGGALAYQNKVEGVYVSAAPVVLPPAPVVVPVVPAPMKTTPTPVAKKPSSQTNAQQVGLEVARAQAQAALLAQQQAQMVAQQQTILLAQQQAQAAANAAAVRPSRQSRAS